MDALLHIDAPPARIGPPTGSLPRHVSHWPAEARHTYRQLLRQLNTWSRVNRWPPTGNPAVAEEAVRQAWSG